LTSSIIISDHSVALKSKEDRIRYTLESISQWLKLSPNFKLVICDGSNFDFSKIVHEQFPNAQIECLFFQNDAEKTRKQGKGYGEGEIINYALHHSTYLQESDFFAKCTGRLWVENFFECLKFWNGRFLCKGYFSNVLSLKKTQFSYVDTRFYLANRAFYLEHFSSEYLRVGGDGGLSIEDCFREVLLKKNMTSVLLSIKPVICGVSGANGTYYKKNTLRRALTENLRLQILKRHGAFKQLFEVN
jgi:hypothetical protein